MVGGAVILWDLHSQEILKTSSTNSNWYSFSSGFGGEALWTALWDWLIHLYLGARLGDTALRTEEATANMLFSETAVRFEPWGWDGPSLPSLASLRNKTKRMCSEERADTGGAQ